MKAGRIASALAVVSLLAAAPFVARQDEGDRPPGLEPIADPPGYAYAVLDHGRVVASGAVGYADRARRTPIDETTVFALGSNAKQFAALAILLLADEGLLTVDDSVRRFVPELPAFMESIKIRHLLFHTAGLPSFMPICEKHPRFGNREVIELLQSQKELMFMPGDRFYYCNTCYALLGEVVKRVSGRAYADYVREAIFAPAGMTSTWMTSAGAPRPFPKQAIGYGDAPGYAPNPVSRCDYAEGPGGVYSDLADYIKWARAMSLPGVFPDAVRTRMMQAGTLETGKVLGYASAWWLSEKRGVPVVEHRGTWPGYAVMIEYHPTEDRWGIVLGNYNGFSPIGAIASLMERPRRYGRRLSGEAAL